MHEHKKKERADFTLFIGRISSPKLYAVGHKARILTAKYEAQTLSGVVNVEMLRRAEL